MCELYGVTNYASKYGISVSLLDHKRIHLHGTAKTVLKLEFVVFVLPSEHKTVITSNFLKLIRKTAYKVLLRYYPVSNLNFYI